jgi:hypothetical protein
MDAVRTSHHRTAGTGVTPELWCFVAGRGHQPGVRFHHRLDIGALPVPGAALCGCHHRHAFALPAVSGIALAAVFASNGIIGGISRKSAKVATPLGITIALTLIGLPFVVRTV